MESSAVGCHVVAMPFPGRGHINPMMNLCKLLASRRADILITFIVTEEWLGFLLSDSKPPNIRFGSIPNVIPSELARGANYLAFLDAVRTKMVDPFEQLLARLEPPVTTIVADTLLFWAVDVANRRNVPVASFWPMSAAVFSAFLHFDLLVQNRHFPVNSSESGDERIDYIPGISSIRIADLPGSIYWNKPFLPMMLEALSWLSKAQYLLLATMYELEAHVVDVLKPKFLFPIYIVGPLIPYFKLGDNYISTNQTDLHYLKWLDLQPPGSVLYISLGSYLPISTAQTNEIATGLRDSGVRCLWVAREGICRFKEICGEMGMVVPWCDQLRVLSHWSVGGFWSHCGWGSTFEGLFAGVPFLTLPMAADQPLNSKLIVEDWKIGWRVKREVGMETIAKRDEIAGLVKRFMDGEGEEGKEIRRRARELREICRLVIKKGGSSDTSLGAFVRDISQY
ncbi:UDP-glycosyltransferase 87A1-like [Vitis riparia]|uniref:UDP-glycosyltransferase 87A1-like n=1 Tax=Vitis riparia TaxID=96939 RepID=UPI00155ABAE7|nr:UDP-glycosyltransferase 87A1-like [Vitis riparia]